jgi:serine protease Do
MMSRHLLPVALVSVAAVTAAGLVAARGTPPSAVAGEEDAPATKRQLRRNAVVEAVERSAPSVVSVGTTRIIPVRYFDWAAFRERQGQQEQRGLGSGVIIHSSGLVVTNAHVINQADQVVVRLTGLDASTEEEIPATILSTDLTHDLALLRLEKPGPYAAATFGRSDDLMPGETVIAIGSPVGLGRTVTTGIVSALNRSMTIEQQTFEGLIQTDAAVNRGNSGGALLNILGEWIGVNSAIASLSNGGSDGISFAIPMETVKSFLSRSIQTGRVTGKWAGLEFSDDPKGGVRVETLFPIGPAIRAGLRQGQRVTRVDGRASTDAALATLAMLDAAPRGRVELTIESAEGTKQVTVPLETPPTERLSWERIGVKADEVTPEVREQTGYPVGSGIVVREVREGGPGARVGLQPGDLLVTLGTQTLRSSEDLLEALQWSDKGTAVPVGLFRPVRTRFGVQAERWKAKLVIE